MLEIEPALPMQRMLRALPMLTIESALPVLNVEPALPILKTEATLPILKALPKLPMLKKLNKLLMLSDLTRLLVAVSPLRCSARFRPELILWLCTCAPLYSLPLLDLPLLPAQPTIAVGYAQRSARRDRAANMLISV